MRGMKTFPDTSPKLPAGGTASSHDQPFQSFQWADYAAKPEHSYTYIIIPMYGSPAALTDGPSLAVDVTTEPNGTEPTACFSIAAPLRRRNMPAASRISPQAWSAKPPTTGFHVA